MQNSKKSSEKNTNVWKKAYLQKEERTPGKINKCMIFKKKFNMSGKSYLIVEEKCLEKYQNVWNFSKASD